MENIEQLHTNHGSTTMLSFPFDNGPQDETTGHLMTLLPSENKLSSLFSSHEVCKLQRPQIELALEALSLKVS